MDKSTATGERTGLLSRHPRLRALMLYLVAPAAVATLAYVAAIALGMDIPRIFTGPWEGSDDRPPIIVRNGSIIFQNGEMAPWKDWSGDVFLGEWKPKQDDADGVAGYSVTLTGVSPMPAACASPVRANTAVEIEFTDASGAPTLFRFHIRKKNVFGKPEPKLDPGPNIMTKDSSPTPPIIRSGETDKGRISKLTIDQTVCVIPQETPRNLVKITIQPKRVPH